MLALPTTAQNASNSGIMPTRPTHSPPDSSRPLLGTLDRYRLSCLLGRGGMAEVFLAAWQVAPEVVRPVVVKRLYGHFSEEPSLVRMFIDEARLVCQLDHENIVKTYEVGLIDGHLCIAMEYLEGQTLQQLVRRGWERGGIPIALSVHIATCALAALKFAHEATDQRGVANEIVHRDVSPQNIFVTNAGQIKVLDFGIAKAKSHEQRTSTGIVKGKFAYIAPEQATGQTVDSRADIWSLGVVLWEMLAGKRLFKADGEAATLNATLHRDIPFLTKLRPEIPIDISLCVAHALQRDPAKRYASTDAMLMDLERYLGRANPRPEAAAISRLMHVHFAEEIVLQQQLVTDLILLHQAQSPSSCPPPSSRTDTILSRDGELSLDGTETQALLRQLRQRNRVALSLLLSVVMILLVVCAWFWRSSLGADHAQVAVAEAKPAASPAVSATAAVIAGSMQPTPPAAIQPATAPPIPIAVAEPPSTSTIRAKTAPVKIARATAVARVPSEAPSAASADNQVATAEYGYLTIDTTPWSNVSWKGKSLGQTPLIKAKLPSGTHTFMLRNADLGIEMQYTVTIVADQTVVKRIGLK